MTKDSDPLVPTDATVDERSTERLKQEIEQTKDGLSETISALEEKFSPSQVREAIGEVEERVRGVLADQVEHAKTAVQAEVVEAKNALREGMRDAERMIRTGLADAKESVKTDLKEAVTGAKESLRAATLGRVETLATKMGDTMNDARDTLLDTLYNNPLPATVTGVGLLWLLMNRSRSARYRAQGWNGSGGQAGATVGQVAQQATGAVARGMQGATDAMGDAFDSASEVVTSIAQTTSEGVQQAAHTVTDGARSLVGTAQHGAKRVERTVERALRERPLAVGAAALAIGTMVGCALPRTTTEDELMGETRDSLLSRAGDAVHDAAATVTKMSETSEEGDTAQSRKTGQPGRQENTSGSRPSSSPTA